MGNKLAKTALTLALLLTMAIIPVSAGPLSTNYELKEYSFGGGGSNEIGSSSSNYKIYGTIGETEGGTLTSDNFSAGTGFNYTLMNVPSAPTISNPANYYNKLQLVVNNGVAPSDTKFAIAISPDNFATTTKYVQNDGSIATILGPEDWQTYTGWGGAGGLFVIGLESNTMYTVKASAMQGNFTQSGFGPTTQAATTESTLSFDIDIASTDAESASPYALSLGSLNPGSVTTATNKVWVDVDTNATGGALIYVKDSNGGLFSPDASHTITAVNSDLVSLDEGYGLQGVYTDQTAYGPMQIVAPFNGSSSVVGAAASYPKLIFDSSSQKVDGGRASFEIKAKISPLTKAGQDYSDILTVVLAVDF